MKRLKHKTLVVITFIALLLLFVFYRDSNHLFLMSGIVIILFLGLTIYGVFQIRFNYFVDSINKGKGSSVYLSFDDGPDPEITPKILEILESENIKAAFFVIGNKVELYPGIVKELHEKGHLIANHTYSHSNKIAMLSKEKLMNDINKCSAAIEKAIGKPSLYFRPPYGITTPRYRSVLNQLKLTSFGWTLRSFDTLMKSKEQLINRVARLISPGSIILLHDNRKVTLEALPGIISHCKKNGIKIASFAELTRLTS